MFMLLFTNKITEYQCEDKTLIRSIYLDQPGVVAQTSTEVIGGLPVVGLVVQVLVVR